jgi:hypothetical protein
MPQKALGGQELRVGSAGVPLAVAKILHRRVVINREQPRKVWEDLELSEAVGKRMTRLLKRHGLPSQKRLIVLSLGYPERTHAEIAKAFACTVDVVQACSGQAADLRRAEPLSTELWEDLTEKDVAPQEAAERAAAVRRTWRGNGLDQRPLSERLKDCAPGGAGVGGDATRPWARYGARGKARPARPQPKERLLPNAGRSSGRAAGDQG